MATDARTAEERIRDAKEKLKKLAKLNECEVERVRVREDAKEEC